MCLGTQACGLTEMGPDKERGIHWANPSLFLNLIKYSLEHEMFHFSKRNFIFWGSTNPDAEGKTELSETLHT